MIEKAYTDDFYDNQIIGSTNSAIEILRLLFNFYRPQSVIDVGCGRGVWLAAAESLGVQDLKGLDGKWVQNLGLVSELVKFHPCNFEEKFVVNRKYDLCISVEVAEHITKKNAKQFIDSICKTSSVILFSAAIKGQGGKNHFNEQPQSYWINLFNEYGYECLDILRAPIWNNNKVDWWYKQNIFLFYDPNQEAKELDGLKKDEKPIADLVHPQHLESKISQYNKNIHHPTFRFIAGRIWHYFSNMIHRQKY